MAEKPAKEKIKPLTEERKKTCRKLWSLLWKMEDIKKTENGTLRIGVDSSRFLRKANVFGIQLVIENLMGRLQPARGLV